LGDEGILQAIMDELGDNEYSVSTTLPFTMLANYHRRFPQLKDVRQIYDTRTDFDAYILGGGKLNWGYGWRQALAVFSSGKPSMNYAVAYGKHPMLYHPKLNDLYAEFLKQFSAVTVRDQDSYDIMQELGVNATLTMCPAINLKEEKTSCPENMIVVCPRYEDSDQHGNSGDNKPQIDWIVNRLKGQEDEVLLIPFAPKNMEGVPVDLALCREISSRLKGAMILPTDGFNPRQVKYAISKAKTVISGGRYHALIWAISHNKPYEVCPSAIANYPRIQSILRTHQKYGDKLKEMEKANVEIFKKIVSERGD
jgi:polysaccharide pyruvyl transferase WcaK-like protein